MAIGCWLCVFAWSWLAGCLAGRQKESWMWRRVGSERSMANCVTQWKPLRDGRFSAIEVQRRRFKSFQGEARMEAAVWMDPRVNWEWQKDKKREEEFDYWICWRVNCVGKHAAKRAHRYFSEERYCLSPMRGSPPFTPDNLRKNETAPDSSAVARLAPTHNHSFDQPVLIPDMNLCLLQRFCGWAGAGAFTIGSLAH